MEKSLGVILRACRKKKELLIRQVASSIEIDQAILSKYETDKKLPTKEHVDKLANLYEEAKNEIMIAYLSDKMAEDLKDEDLLGKVMKAAEEKIKYNKLHPKPEKVKKSQPDKK